MGMDMNFEGEIEMEMEMEMDINRDTWGARGQRETARKTASEKQHTELAYSLLGSIMFNVQCTMCNVQCPYNLYRTHNFSPSLYFFSI